jgi:MoaA/NifB/PqqE/SkfB family radical SAM enzyme
VVRAPEDLVAVPSALRGLRRFALDGALLLFDRDTGLTAICDGEETAHLRMRAPRVVQFAITNACNLACTFCSRDVDARSGWTVGDAFDLLRDLDDAGTLEVAFGGGEPLVFKGFVGLVERLFRETRLAVSLTTNGVHLTYEVARALAPFVGQIRVSLYDDVDAGPPLDALGASGARFGVNWLVTPARLPDLETTVISLAARGCTDVLLLSYNGRDPSLHLAPEATRDLAERVRLLERALRGRMLLKLDVCWGDRLERVPTLMRGPCAAGREFVVVTSDRRLAPCSFHHDSIPFASARELLDVWAREKGRLAAPARDPGCARAPGYGLARHLPVIDR